MTMSSIPIPSDLINQIQSTLRSKSKIYPSSNPSLPSLNDLIAGFDSDDDPSHLRCPNCLRSGGFIRGDHSTLCIFCGRDRGKDGITHSMSFKSTLACKNLLQYLQLDGSETINSNTKSDDSNKGRETQQSHMVLSSLLDLELKWPSKKEEANESPVKDEVSVQAVNLAGAEVSVPAVNLSGADFDNFFTDSMNRTIGASTAPIVINEKSLPLKQSVNKENPEASRNDDTSLFNAIQTSNVAISSINIEGNQDGFDSFADWDASFESANSGTGHSESKLDDQKNMFSKSIDFFEGSTASFAVSETSIKEPVNSQGNINNSGKNDGSTDEWGIFSDNMVQNNQTAISASNLKSTDLTTENDSWGDGEVWATASNTKGKMDDIGDSLAEGEIWATPSNSESQHDGIGDKNQSTDDWGDFSSVSGSSMVRNDAGTNKIDHLQSTSKTNDGDIWGHNELWASMSNTNDNDDMGDNIEVLSPADNWGNFPSVTSSNNMVQNDVVANTTDHLQSTSKTNDNDFWGKNELWASIPSTKSKSDDNDDRSDNIGAVSLADDWGNFSSSDKTIENKLLNTRDDIRSTIKTTENVSWDQDEIWATIPTTKTEHDNNVEADNHEEPTDDWGDFFYSDIMLQNDPSNKFLQLDGSETIKFDTKSNDSGNGQETQQSHVVLPGLRDLEQKWPTKKEEVVNINLEKDEPSVPAVNLSGADIDMFFTDSMNMTTGSSTTAPITFNEKSLPLKQSGTTENQEASRKYDTFLFNAIQTSNVVVSSSNIEGSQDGFDSFADWDASFQSANSGTHSESKTDDQNAMFSKSVDLIEGSTASLAISETSAKEPVNYSQGNINNTGNSEGNADEWGIFSNNMVQKNVLVDSDSSDLKRPNLKDENDNWGEGEEIWATASDNTKVKCDDMDVSWGEGEIWATASNSKGQHDDIGDKNQPTDDWGDFSFVTVSNSIVQNDAVINNTTDHLQSTNKTNDIDIWGDNELWSSMFTTTKSKSNDNGDLGNNNIGAISSADNLDKFSSVTDSSNMVQNEIVINTTDHLQSTSKTNDIDIWGDNEPWSSIFTTTKSKSNDNGDMGNNNIGVISSADKLGNFSSVSGSNNMVQNEVLTNTTDHLQSTSKTNDSVIFRHDELWASISSNTKGKSDDNDEMGNSNIGVSSPAEDDWGNFSSSNKMIKNDLFSTGNDTRSTIKTNEDVSWDQDEIWTTISAAKSEHNNNDEIDNHGEPEDDDWGSYESAT